MLGQVSLLLSKLAVSLPPQEESPRTRFAEASFFATKPKSPASSAMVPANSLKLFLSNPLEQIKRVNFDFPDPRGTMRKLTSDIEFIRSRSSMVRDRIALAGTFASKETEADIETIRKILPSIVRISAENAFGSAWYGSGSIAAPLEVIPDYEAKPGEYFIITNHHVANDAKYTTIKLPNGQEYKAELVRSPRGGAPLMNAAMDIALLRVYMPYSLPTITIGDPKQLRIGQPIYTAGHPRALPNVAVTKGVISNPQQETGELSLDIQSDAPINPGNSGGPSFNQAGEIIGLNTYTFREGEDLTFTKPIDEQIDTLLNIWENGHMVRGTFGFEVEPLPLIERIHLGFPDDETGAIISDIATGSPAEKAGLMPGDIVTWMEVRQKGYADNILDVDIHDSFEANGVIKRWAAKLLPGTTVNMIVYRKEKNAYLPREIRVKVGLNLE